VLNRWNSLPHQAVESASVAEFKKHLERLRATKMGFFMDRWSA